MGIVVVHQACLDVHFRQIEQCVHTEIATLSGRDELVGVALANHGLVNVTEAMLAQEDVAIHIQLSSTAKNNNR